MKATTPTESRHTSSRRTFMNQSTLALTSLAISPFGVQATAKDGVATDRFPISLHQYSLKKLFDSRQLNLLSYAKFAKQTLGISNVEFAGEFCGELLGAPDKIDAVRQQSKDVGVKNRVFLCAAGKALDASSAQERSEAINEHKQWAKVAEGLGCEFLRVRASTEGDREQQLKNAAEGIGGLCDAIKQSHVSVLIENIVGLSRDPDWLVKLVETIGVRRVGLVADFGNFDGDIYAGMKRLLPYTKSICTKSWEFDDDGNETKIDFSRMMKIVKDSNFRGCISIEYLGEQPVSGIQKTAALVKRYSKST